MKFISILLKEGRKEDLEKKYSDKIDPEVLNFVLNSPELIAYNHKYTDFILRDLYLVNEGGSGLDIAWWLQEEYIPAINLFDKYQSQLEKKDINQYKSLGELATATHDFAIRDWRKKMESKVDKIFENDRYLVVVPKTHEASCKYGANTKWCTTSVSDTHFKQYTSGRQRLYYIIDKKNSTNQDYSKIAIHFDNSKQKKYWDSQDSPMSEKEIRVFEYAFPEIIEAINEDYKKNSLSEMDIKLKSFFNNQKVVTSKISVGKNSFLNIKSEGFHTINDLGPGHAQGTIEISLNDNVIDAYEMFLTYNLVGDKVKCSLGFMGRDLDSDDLIDLGLERFGLDFSLNPNLLSDVISVLTYIINQIKVQIEKNEDFIKKVFGANKLFTPKYGYTFGRNKGWIKKLIKYLESDKKGTKLDFLVDVGYLKKKVDNGKVFYRRPDFGDWQPQRFWRGQHASFFSAAKNAGILNYEKQGKDYFLIKGPNFDEFKQGKLKSL